MHDRLKFPDDPYDTQLNVRVTERVARHIPRLKKLNGETTQALFDRLVGEEYERYIVEHADEMIDDNQKKIDELRAEIDDIHSITSESTISPL